MSQAVRDGDFVHEIYEILPHADFKLIGNCVLCAPPAVMVKCCRRCNVAVSLSTEAASGTRERNA